MTMPLALTAFDSALLAHLWQSTAFAAGAWMLVLTLRRYPARVRFWVWMSASIKFLVPFALLSDLGARWAKPHPVPTVFLSVIEEFNQPFAKGQPGALSQINPAHTGQGEWIPWTLSAVWILGIIWMIVCWSRQWQRARRLVRSGRPLHTGPEIVALREGESHARIHQPLSIVMTSAAVEPGVFGIIRPVLLWPEGLSERLDDVQVRTIMAHELEHVRQRDNLSSAIHSIITALFWFHPALHWMSTRMNEERERACDESVIERNAHARRYAESILKVCKFCLEAPSPCIAGVSGGDLKKRIQRIVNHRTAAPLTFGRRSLLVTTALLTIALPVGMGIVHGQTSTTAVSGSAETRDLPKYDVASIKPGSSAPGPSFLRFNPDGTSAHSMPLQFLLRAAFGVENDRLIGVPSWAQSNRYDIEAKVAPEEVPQLDKLTAKDRQAMLIPLLVERFNLKYHHETRELPQYALVVAKGGAKLKTSTPRPLNEPPGSPFAGTPPKGLDTKGRMMMSPGRIESQDTTLDMLAHALAPQLGCSVVDKTGLTGRYDYTLQWTPDNAPMPAPGTKEGSMAAAPETDATGESLFTAIQEQLGLKLEAEKGKVDVIVIDHIDLPSPN